MITKNKHKIYETFLLSSSLDSIGFNLSRPGNHFIDYELLIKIL